MVTSPARADYKGLFLVINPYSDEINPPCYLYSPDWLDSNQCEDLPAKGNLNQIPGLLARGQVSGVVLQIDWDKFVEDGGEPSSGKLHDVLTTINNIAVANGRRINLGVGLIAGIQTPCSVLEQGPLFKDGRTGQQNLLAGISLTTPGDHTSDLCAAVPVLSSTPSTPGPFAAAYMNALGNVFNAVKQIESSFAANSLVNAVIKVGGFNGRNFELTIPGDGYRRQGLGDPDTTAQTQQCGAGFPYYCYNNQNNSEADAWLTKYGYEPDSVENTWNLIVSTTENIQRTLGSPVLELNIQGPEQVPPIASTANATNFHCYNPNGQAVNGEQPCVVYYDDTGKPVTNAFVENVLITDVINGSGPNPAISPTTVAVQYDGLRFNQDNSDGKNTTEATLVTKPTCWAYSNYSSWTQPGYTIIGFQSASDQDFANDGQDYLTSLQHGVDFGAQYEELIPTEANYYMNISAPSPSLRGNSLGAIQSSLLTNPINDPDSYCN